MSVPKGLVIPVRELYIFVKFQFLRHAASLQRLEDIFLCPASSVMMIAAPVGGVISIGIGQTVELQNVSALQTADAPEKVHPLCW